VVILNIMIIVKLITIMKKVVILLTFSMFAVFAMAQVTTLQPTQRGNFVIGSRIGFSTAKSTIEVTSATGSVKGDGGSSAQFNFAPAIGYFFAKNIVLGIGMDWLNTSSKTGVDVTGGTASPQESNNNNVLFGPFVRYFIPTGDDNAFFIGTSVSFGNSKNEFTGSSNEKQSVNNSLLTIGVGPGFTIYAKNGLALEALVKYNFAKSDSEINVQGIKRTSESWTNAVDFSVGLQYYFGGFRTVSIDN
jgi:outer membrane protein W